MINRVQAYEAAVAQAEHVAEQYATTARRYLAEASERVKEFIHDKPALALAAGVGAGVILGWLIKRR